MTVRRGTYVLLITLGTDTVMDVGALGEVRLTKGTYCYTGSAMGGLDQRLARHLSHEKKVRWHVDRLTMVAERVEAFESYPKAVPECTLASMAVEAGMRPAVKGFGCSDCRCTTHLFEVVPGSDCRLVSMAGLMPFHTH